MFRRRRRAIASWLLCGSAAASACSTSRSATPTSLHARASAVVALARPFDGRFAVAQTYAPCRTRSAEQHAIASVSCASAPDSRALASASAVSVDVSRVLSREPTTDALWAAALLDLWSAHRDSRTVDRVIGRLTEVYARDTMSTLVLNDLALAHLARASDRDDARDLYAALDFIEHAFERDSASPAIRFNRAVILERAHIDAQAAAAWKRVAEDVRDPWAPEARERQRRLESSTNGARVAASTIDRMPPAEDDTVLASIVRRDPQTAREYVLDTLVTRWSRATLADDTGDASSAAHRAATIGRALLSASGDSSVIHVAAEILGAQERSATARSLAAALREAADGAARFHQTQFVSAEPELRTAAQNLRRLGAPMLADWTELFRAAVEMQRSNFQEAERAFNGIAARANVRHAIALEARALWGMALSQGRRGAANETERSYRIALGDFERLGETSNAGFMQALGADILHALGRSAEQAHARHSALEALHRRNDPGLRYAVLLALGQRLDEAGLHHAALVAVREAVSAAETTGRAKDIPESLGRLASAQVELGDIAQAEQSIVLARRAMSGIADSIMHARLDAEVARAEAVAAGRRDPRRALERLDQVARYFAKAQIPTDYAPALTKRADVRLAVGDSAGALADLDSATAVVTTLASSKSDRETVRQLVGTQSDAYRRLVAISLARGDTTSAYRYSELSRADAVVSGRSAPAPSVVPAADEARIAYVFAGDRLLIWTVTRASSMPRVTVVPARPAEIGALTTRFVNLIREDADPRAETEVARRLYDVLIAPVERALSAVRHVVLVPDSTISGVPFAALRDGRGRYLIERFALAYAERLAAGSHVRQRSGMRAAGALLVGNPAWDRALFQDLDVLRSADSEIEAIRALHAGASVLTGGAATREAFLRELPRHELVHFAGHARVVREAPASSHLVMARDTSGFVGNVVYASDIARLDLRGVRLAILSACGESQDRYAGAGSRNGLVQALLDAGVGAVIASQWEADDAGAAELMLVVHEGLSARIRGDEALRRAQIELARRRPTPSGALGSERLWSTYRYYVE